MTLHANSIGKKFKRRWIFKDLNARFEPGSATAILGPNGSGKSTFLRVISGQLSQDLGQVRLNDATLMHRDVNFMAPYIDVPAEFTLGELFQFHANFRNLYSDLQIDNLAKRCHLEHALNLPLKEFSSGMQQRVKIALALFYRSAVLLLDEPCSHLDEEGVHWYNDQLSEFSKDRIVLIGSNDRKETQICDRVLNIVDFK